MLIKVEQCSQYIMCKKLLIKHLYDIKTKQNRYMHKKRKLKEYSPEPSLSLSHGLQLICIIKN